MDFMTRKKVLEQIRVLLHKQKAQVNTHPHNKIKDISLLCKDNHNKCKDISLLCKDKVTCHHRTKEDICHLKLKLKVATNHQARDIISHLKHKNRHQANPIFTIIKLIELITKVLAVFKCQEWVKQLINPVSIESFIVQNVEEF